MDEALFTVLGDGRFQPTGHSRGPWSPDALHGGPVAALVSLVAEDALAATGREAHVPVRLTLDLERPVPLAPLTVTAEIVRPGRKVQVAEVTVRDDEGRRLVRASVLAIRRLSIDLPDDLPMPVDPPPPPHADGGPGPTWPGAFDLVAFHKDGTVHDFVRGSFLTPGPTVDWIRLAVPVVAGRDPSPFQRVVAAADFVNGISSPVPAKEWTFINPDLTVTVHRLPVGEWVALDAGTRVDGDGTGTAEADLYDASGRLGRAVQTLLVEHR
ncbi:MAG: thioesterase family protein [Actinobacteria bacterium]|nr:thioesterase family protein [Actinomycetota bacterium]